MRILMFLVVLCLALSVPAVPAAQAAQECGDRAKGMKELKERYSEEPISMGLTSDGSVVEVFASDAGSFTIVKTRSDGVSCMIAAGDNWEKMQSQLNGTKI